MCLGQIVEKGFKSNQTKLSVIPDCPLHNRILTVRMNVYHNPYVNMRSLKRVFEKIKRENPYLSDYTCFSQAISGKDFSKKTVSRHFKKLVDNSDYPKKEKKAILEWLFSLSKRQKIGLRKANSEGKLTIIED